MKPETSVSYDFGFYRKLGKSFDMRIAGNYINTSNYFVNNTASSYYSGGDYAYQIGKMEFFGGEFEFNWTPFEKLVLFGNYSYLRNQYSKNANLPYAMMLELPPRNKGKLSARYELPLRTRLVFDLKMIGERRSEGGFTLDRYAVGDVSFERNFNGRMTAGFFVNNMFGKEYQQVYGYPAPGVTWGMRLQVSTAKNILSR